MNLSHLFQSYENLVIRADAAFQKMADAYPEFVTCRRQCSDCCYAVFGLFLIEAVYLNRHFGRMGRKERRETIVRGNRADMDLERLKKRMQTSSNDSQVEGLSLARERIRCPLLDEGQECILYPHRPITCRVYGIPTAIQGKARVCGRTGFKKGESYPTFDLDGVYRELYVLSKELLESAGSDDLEQASLLISVSKAISSPLEDLVSK
jgi:Fe-S-cluster containining protein